MTDPGGDAPRARDIARDASFAAFEQHTTGFGSRMLSKMGFKERLGKNETGVINPIEPTTKRIGIAGDSRKRSSSSHTQTNSEDAPTGVPAKRVRLGPTLNKSVSSTELTPIVHRLNDTADDVDNTCAATLSLPTDSAVPPQSTLVPTATVAASTAADAAPVLPFTLLIVHPTAVCADLPSIHQAAWIDAFCSYFQVSRSDPHVETSLQTIQTLQTYQLIDRDAFAVYAHQFVPLLQSLQIEVAALAEWCAGLDSSTDAADAVFDAVVSMKEERYFELCKRYDQGRGIRPAAGLYQLLHELKTKQGWTLATVHVGSRERMNFDLTQLGVRALFAACVSAQSLTTEVQRPYLPLYEEVIQRVADHMPCQTLAVCTTQFEVLATLKAGCHALHWISASNDHAWQRCAFYHPVYRLVTPAVPSTTAHDELKRACVEPNSKDQAACDPAVTALGMALRPLRTASPALAHAGLNELRIPAANFRVGSLCAAVYGVDQQLYACAIQAVETAVNPLADCKELEDVSTSYSHAHGAGARLAGEPGPVSSVRYRVVFDEYGNEELVEPWSLVQLGV